MARTRTRRRIDQWPRAADAARSRRETGPAARCSTSSQPLDALAAARAGLIAQRARCARCAARARSAVGSTRRAQRSVGAGATRVSVFEAAAAARRGRWAKVDSTSALLHASGPPACDGIRASTPVRRRQQEAQQQRQAVVVVQAGEQHHEQQHRRGQAGTGRQDVDAARAAASAARDPRPAASAPSRSQRVSSRARGSDRNRDGPDERIGDLAAALGALRLRALQAMRGDRGKHRLHVLGQHRRSRPRSAPRPARRAAVPVPRAATARAPAAARVRATSACT